MDSALPGGAALSGLRWKRESLLGWARATPPDWSILRIRSLESLLEPSPGDFAMHFRTCTRHRVRSINLCGLVGRFGGEGPTSWADMLGSIPTSLLDRADLEPGVFFAADGLPEVALVSLDGRIWYVESGCDLAVVAKFLHSYYAVKTGYTPLLHAVRTIEHVIDWPAFRAWKRISQAIAQDALPITLSLSPPVPSATSSSEVRYTVPDARVMDARLPGRLGRTDQALPVELLERYADWVGSAKGSLSIWDTLQFSMASLIPGPQVLANFLRNRGAAI